MGKGETLVTRTKTALHARITKGEFPVGARLPSEARLCEEYGISRTVIREAIAALRFEGLVEPRQGAGVFVIGSGRERGAPFANVDSGQLSSVIEMLELRTAAEVECAALAALRHAPAQGEAISQALHDSATSVEADWALHTAIAEATNNPRFVQFLALLGPQSIPRAALSRVKDPGYLERIWDEHRAIVDAILDRNAEAARAAMRRHLEGSQKRYRAMLRARQP